MGKNFLLGKQPLYLSFIKESNTERKNTHSKQLTQYIVYVILNV